ncbi:MAG: S8 family serine peptidase [Xenococcaceae cyanobacterium MO_167.B27]|nr:S8 family serine peptidase [Xenococcaceae cyanobacterium MO_167.B27]
MNKRLFLIFICSLGLIIVSNFINHENQQLYGTSLDTASIQKHLLAQNETELEYLILGQKIPLTLKQDTTAVVFKPQKKDRGNSGQPYHIQLQEHLSVGDRASERKSEVEITPLGQNYALVKLAVEDQDISVIETEIQKQDYVKEVLPVLTLSNSDSSTARDIILPNEIIVSFDGKISEAEREAILKENNLELIRPVRFSSNLYIVKSLTASGVEVLKVANELNAVTSISTAAPNFIETFIEEISLLDPFHPPLSQRTSLYRPKTVSRNEQEHLAFRPDYDSLLGIQWHLKSSRLKSCLNSVKTKTIDTITITQCSKDHNLAHRDDNSRTDVRAIESWKDSNQGEGVVVAVIDSLIQWDHPDLINSIYKVRNVAQKLPGETRGWDFVEEDNDTRLEPDQVHIIRHFRNAFILDSAMIKWRYPQTFSELKQKYPQTSEAKIIRTIRQGLVNEVAGRSFHGTTVAGVIAANPQDNQGVYGVAPKAKILPITAGDGQFSAVNLIESIGYAETRGADIINLSLGRKLPNLLVIQRIQQLLQANPNVVIVAASGNNGSNQIDYLAAIPGVIAVGATNMEGFRPSYSDYGSDALYGSKLTVVAPGGDFATHGAFGGVLTTGGTAQPLLMDGLTIKGHWGPNWDLQGKYRWSTGTSFSTPVVSGIVALIKGEDRDNRLNRQDIIDILQKTASYDQLNLRNSETRFYNTARPTNFNSPEEYFFGAGLVNAEAAVEEAKARLYLKQSSLIVGHPK